MSTLLLIVAAGGAIVAVDHLSRRAARRRRPLSIADWRRLARRCALSVHNNPEPHLSGHIGSIPVSVTLSEDVWEVGFRVRASLRAAAPAGMHLTASDHGRGDTPLQSPVLAATVSASGGPQVAALLDDPDLVGPLLAVLHRWPGASVDACGVTIDGETDQPGRTLPEALAAAAALAGALTAALQNQAQGASDQ
ncbi:MAG: hypothetical protein ACI8S6_001239 [Myxococcota bacterium]